jgi:hypothetical protein
MFVVKASSGSGGEVQEAQLQINAVRLSRKLNIPRGPNNTRGPVNKGGGEKAEFRHSHSRVPHCAVRFNRQEIESSPSVTAKTPDSTGRAEMIQARLSINRDAQSIVCFTST